MIIYHVTNCCQLKYYGTSNEIKVDEHCVECGAPWVGATRYKIGVVKRED
jgi:hypothetical protein